MVVDIAIVVITLLLGVLVGFLIPTLLQIKKAIAESQRLLAHLNSEVPGLIKEVRVVTGNMGVMAEHARDSMEHASVLLHAVGELGESVQQAHHVMRGKSGALLANLASVIAGVRAASAVVRERVHHDHLKEGGEPNGKR